MAVHLPVIGGHVEGFGSTARTDAWWQGPAITFFVFSLFIVYTTWAALQGDHYYADPYLSPFYSPVLFSNAGPSVHGAAPEAMAWFGTWPRWWPSHIPVSPAILILVFPGSFRFTCYYYRKAYFRSFWLSPPACAVAEPHKAYTGERRFPLILNNAHRWFFYLGLVLNTILTYDAILGFRNAKGDWGHMGLGTLVLLANATLLWLYSLSCHSCRHAIAGRLNHFSRHPLRYKAWTLVSRLNHRHAQFAWVSLIGVALTDYYVYLIASGAFSDPRFF
jgi:hypothetical protein